MAAAAKKVKTGSVSFLFTLFLFIFATTISFSSAYGGRLGGREDIKNVKSNKQIQALGNFSVQEYNKNHHAHLTFVEVVQAQSQVVAGMEYYLKINASDSPTIAAPKEFDAVVFVQPWRKSSKQLVSFAPSTHN